MAGKGVLVVDDSALARGATVKLLSGAVDPVLTASSGPEALELIDRPEVAVVISDYQMPGMNGIELLARVRERRPEVVRILLTGVADLGIALEAINSGHVTKFFTKSIPREELKEALLQICQYSDVISGTQAAAHKTVLIADASRIAASMIEQVLGDKYRILTVSDGLAALKLIEREPIDLLVTSSQLRYLAGPELVAHLKQEAKVTFPIILLTAGSKVELGGVGPDLVVRKSDDLANLFKAINGILQG